MTMMTIVSDAFKHITVSSVVLNGWEIYAPQTKILEGGTKDEMRIFEALFKGVSTQFGPWTIEKCFENPHFIFCSSFQNLRLGAIHLHLERFGKEDADFRSTFQGREYSIWATNHWKAMKKRYGEQIAWFEPISQPLGQITMTLIHASNRCVKQTGQMVEYSRMQVPSFRSKCMPPLSTQTTIWEGMIPGWTDDGMWTVWRA